MPYEVMEIQATPNPNALKFVLDHAIASQPMSFFSAESARDHAIASGLFSVAGVSSLLLLNDFVTVNKQSDAGWPAITGRVREVLKKS